MDIDPRKPLDPLRTSSLSRRPPRDLLARCRHRPASIAHDDSPLTSHPCPRIWCTSQCMAIVGGLRMFVMRPRTLRAGNHRSNRSPDQRVLVHDAIHPALTKRAQRRGPGTDRRDRGKTTGYLRSLRAERAREASSIIGRVERRVGRYQAFSAPRPSPRPPFARTSPRSTRARNASRRPRARERARAPPSVALRSFSSLYVYASNLSSHFWVFLRVSVASVGPSSP